MKNLKYLQIFEAFESKTLSKVFNYVNNKQKGHFKTILSDLCDKLNFPMSDLSDDLFQYLPFNKALQLTANIEDEPCDNESDTIPGEVCSGPTGDAEQGTIMRTWGRGRRRVECPVCKGTGIKPKTSFPIKWIKFWFDKDGKYVTSTITDGQIRDQGPTYTGRSLDTNLDNYERAETVRWNELSNYSQGDFFLFSDGSLNGTGVAMLWKSGGQNFMLQNFSAGSEPSGSEWRKVARYSWVVTSSGDLRGGSVIKLNPKKKGDQEKEEDKPDPYSWNALVNLRNLSIQRSSKVKEELQPAHFALVLDYVKMKDKTKESTFKDTQVTKQKRAESRVDAAALKLPNDVKSENYKRYIQKISNSLKVTTDILSIRNIFMRVLGLEYAGYYVLQGLNFGELEIIMSRIINLILLYEKSNLDSETQQETLRSKSEILSSKIRDVMETTVRYNNNMKRNIDYMYTNSPSSDHNKILDKLAQVNNTIRNKIRDEKLESIEDVVIFYGKIIRMKEDFENSPLFEEAYKAKNVNYYLEGTDEDRCLRCLQSISSSDIDGILSSFDTYIKYINRA